MVTYIGLMIVLMIVAIPMWKIGKKFGYDEYWKFVIPIYNLGILCECAGIPKKMLLLVLLPVAAPYLGISPRLVNTAASFIFFSVLSWGLAKRLGKNEILWFVVGGLFFFIPLVIFAFDSSMPEESSARS